VYNKCHNCPQELVKLWVQSDKDKEIDLSYLQWETVRERGMLKKKQFREDCFLLYFCPEKDMKVK